MAETKTAKKVSKPAAKPAAKAVEEKKKPVAAAPKVADAAEKKPAAPKAKKKSEKPRAHGTKKTKEQKKILAKIAAKKKKKLPTFRGRFGKKMIRRVKMKRWNKWRHNRGIDIKWGQQHGFRPDMGYRTAKEIRGMHPSGMHEMQIRTISELANVPKGYAVRMMSKIGHKKRVMIANEAKKLGIKLLN
jgi:large subunit ribosomal protein L32e